MAGGCRVSSCTAPWLGATSRRGSDVDVLIVRDEEPHDFREQERAAHLVSGLSLLQDVTISRTHISVERWRDSDKVILSAIAEGDGGMTMNSGDRPSRLGDSTVRSDRPVCRKPFLPMFQPIKLLLFMFLHMVIAGKSTGLPTSASC